ncbi:MAG TPA: nucleoside-diphosphate sugar epimerase/dehydratase [Anaerolineales bacterium]|nr:nucleoside-diphosphate sugar epimerase/dehydratase [Anaerolineales bacterium]HMX73266.1 nucleoside-diphosphate sugar epimerase/dehydratase [Anaerolineales bacterium]HMZ42867.1 nucleoside-diphosphate sugar epimerase/dehydratase [Anaerolineales bacterium]HNA54085.1 nucleoside-diphosphate sugar epimerase/dehydratase [Anaerolineales bacterium]HNB86551.1 nucleoside-diphosphate sugar epimerase/dehydratase [Anaerolineales bacterium]
MSSRPHIRNRFVLIGDLALIVISVLGSFALRLDVSELPFYFPAALVMCAVALLVKVPVYFYFGLYRRLWVYASTSELRLITIAVTSASALTSGVMILLSSIGFIQPGMPRSALGIDWLFSLVLIGGSRFALRILAEQSSAPRDALRVGKRALIIGAGDAGALVVRELQKSSQLNLFPVGFLDDDPAKQNHQIYGVSVIGRVGKLADVLESQRIDEVIIAIPSAPGKIIRAVNDACRKKGIPSRTMPGIYELLGGKVSVNRLREVDITDLLRRDHVRVNDEQVGQALEGKRVLVTGAGGSIGRELCRQIARRNPSQLILLGHGENSIFEILLELQNDYAALKLIPVIADIRNGQRLDSVFAQHHPQVVFHAAAHKHVPLMEANPVEAITNNVLGTRNVVQAALDHNVERFILISTDKAVNPSSIYGATKRLAEAIVLDAAHKNKRAFAVVRFGNVLGSRGSIIPIFKNQIANGGPVTITHPDMFRFFMTIPEAVYLVLQASSMNNGGEVFVLNMGEPVRILDLAEDLIKLSGLEPQKDIEIAFTGIRPGEKLTEELWVEGTSLIQTPHPDIFRLDQDAASALNLDLVQAIEQLSTLSLTTDAQSIARLLDQLIPGSTIFNAPHDYLEV